MSRDTVYRITTDGCGRLYVEEPDGEVLASAPAPADDAPLVEYQEAIAKLMDAALEEEDKRI